MRGDKEGKSEQIASSHSEGIASSIVEALKTRYGLEYWYMPHP